MTTMCDKTRDIGNKSACFREVLGFLPFCHKAVTMTGLTAIDARQLAEAGKFGRETFITNYDTMLPSWNKGISVQSEFKRKWNDVMKGILDSDSRNRKILFKDIFKSSLVASQSFHESAKAPVLFQMQLRFRLRPLKPSIAQSLVRQNISISGPV